jgi:hypothetical protein
LQFQRRALAPGDQPGQSTLTTTDCPCEDVIKQAGDAISSWLAAPE